MKLIYLESPYAGNIQENERYAKRCALWCLKNGYNPFISHLLYTQFLDDQNPQERQIGISAGFEFAAKCEKSIFFCDLGISKGMIEGIKDAVLNNREIEFIFLDR